VATCFPSEHVQGLDRPSQTPPPFLQWKVLSMSKNNGLALEFKCTFVDDITGETEALEFE